MAAAQSPRLRLSCLSLVHWAHFVNADFSRLLRFNLALPCERITRGLAHERSEQGACVRLDHGLAVATGRQSEPDLQDEKSDGDGALESTDHGPSRAVGCAKDASIRGEQPHDGVAHRSHRPGHACGSQGTRGGAHTSGSLRSLKVPPRGVDGRAAEDNGVNATGARAGRPRGQPEPLGKQPARRRPARRPVARCA